MRFLSTIVILAASCLAGCSGKPSTVPVSGIVTHNKKPVEGANVVFSRGAGDISKGELAIGKTDAQGRFQLITHFGSKESKAGAIPGEYSVTISKQIPPNGMPQAQYQKLVDAANKAGEIGAMVPPEQQPPPMIDLFAGRYAQGKTKLKATVPAGGTSDLSFPLE